jgi:hypothetical protein
MNDIVDRIIERELSREATSCEVVAGMEIVRLRGELRALRATERQLREQIAAMQMREEATT